MNQGAVFKDGRNYRIRLTGAGWIRPVMVTEIATGKSYEIKSNMPWLYIYRGEFHRWELSDAVGNRLRLSSSPPRLDVVTR